MEVTIVGIQISSFVSSDGKSISGANVYYTFARFGVEGFACDRCWFPSRIEVLPSPGDKVKLYFNKIGKLVSYEPC